MFDLLGVVDFQPYSASVELPERTLPSEHWDHGASTVVNGKCFQAKYLEHALNPQSYYFENDLHLFVVGEVFASEGWPAGNARPSGPLTARDVLQLYSQDASRFLRALKGNFTLVLIDEAEGQCELYNGRFGISPFYYALDGTWFVFAASLAAVATCLPRKPEIDPAAVAELALFNYPLGDRTYFRQVKMLRPAEVVRVNAAGLRREAWWDVRTLYNGSLYPREKALEMGSELFHRTVNDLVCDVPRVRMSVTSGFDSRAILAVLEKDQTDLLGYSFGIPGSLNVSIPERLCPSLDVPFYPIYLDGDYECVFDDYARRAILLSDCLSTVERANYPYAFEKLGDFSPVVLTGLFGSELMRTFQNVGHIVSANLVRLNLASDPLSELEQIVITPDAATCFAPDLFGETVEEVEADVSAALTERFGDMPPDRRFYMFLLTEGLRKYFGAEVHMERPWGINRFPYLDDEFVEFAFRTPFAGVHSRTLKPTVQSRFRSQYFYAHVIRKYRPELLEAPTDHGYSPKDVLSPLGLLKIGPKFLLWRWKRKRIGYREFKTEEWTETFYQRRLFETPTRHDLFSTKMEEDFHSGVWKTHRLEFAKAASFKLWLELIEYGGQIFH